MSSPVNPTPVVLQSQPVAASSTPAFLARFPRSLSSLSLGGKKKSTEKEVTPSPNGGKNQMSATACARACTVSKPFNGKIASTYSGDDHVVLTGLTLDAISPLNGFKQCATRINRREANANKMIKLLHHSSASHVGHSVGHHHQHVGGHVHLIPMVSTKSKFTGSTKDLKGSSSDQPPPLPQRNFTRRSQPSPPSIQLDGVDGDVALRRNTQISDLDHSMSNLTCNDNSINNNSGSSTGGTDASNNNRNNASKVSGDAKAIASPASANKANNKKRTNKAKIKANSDPKISSQLLIQMEKDYDKQQIVVATGHSVGNLPPPLPPRQPGMLEESQNFLNNNKFLGLNSGGAGAGATSSASSGNRTDPSASNNSRPSPNSLDTLLNYPLISTCTAVRDNMTAAFPLSHRPNIVQQLQQSSNSNTSNIHQHHSTNSSTCNKSTVSNFLL